MCRRLKARLAERQAAVIEIDEVGLVVVDELVLAQQPDANELRIEGRRGFDPLAVALAVPDDLCFVRADAGRRHIIGAGVELLRVEHLPELAAAVFPAQPICVVAAAAQRPFGIVAVGDLVPMPGVTRMIGDPELQAGLADQWLPAADNILLRSHTGRVPPVVPTREIVEIVVMTAHRHEVARAGGGIALHQIRRVPLLGFPPSDDVDEAAAAGVAVMLEMVLVGAFPRESRLASRHGHQARIPVAPFGLALWPRMGPEPELGVAEPFGDAIVAGERVPGRRDRTRSRLADRPAG